MNLTKGQRLRVDRQRRGETQRQAAKRLDVAHKRYRYWEWDEYTWDAPRVKLGRLAPHERCLLLRREAGLSQRELAEAIGVTRQYLNKMEAGKTSCRRLVEYWHGSYRTGQ